MANPAIKNGYLPIANELAEHFALVNITGQEWRILWVVLRQTWGWKQGKRRKDWDWISYTQFEKKTGMKRSNCYNALKSLLVKRLIVKSENGYKFNQNYNEWVLAKRLTLLVKRLIPISQKTNKSVSQLTTYKRNKETITKETLSSNDDLQYISNSSVGKDKELYQGARELIRHFSLKYEEVFKEKPTLSPFVKYIKLSKPLVSELGVDRLKRMVDVYFITFDDNFITKTGFSFSCFLLDNTINKLKNKTL